MRNRPRKTNFASFSDEDMRNAVRSVVDDGISLRIAAREKNIPFQTLFRYVKKQKTLPGEHVRMTPNYANRKVFTAEQEDSLSNYILQCSKMFYGITTIECRKLAFQMASVNEIKMPASWANEAKAGLDWYLGFMKRHPRLSLRSPEQCSIARATAFNPYTVGVFFNNLKRILERDAKFADGTRIYNLDETGVSTVHRPPRVLAEKGSKLVQKCTSAEKGTLVTVCCIASAVGNTIPPTLIFPRVNYKQHMMANGPPGALGLANPSGWMTTELFVEVLKHYIHHTQSSRENPTLLIYDNHESHLSIAAPDLAKQHGVTILTLPPHSSHRMQPLDVGIFKPFKTYYDAAVDSWMVSHPASRVTIYEIASFVNYAHQRAMVPSNIINSFRKTGIYPFNEHTFTEVDFLSSSVTDRPYPNVSEFPSPTDEPNLNMSELSLPSTPVSKVAPSDRPNLSMSELHIPSTSVSSLTPTITASPTGSKPDISAQQNFVSPAEFRGYPKSEGGNESKRGRGRKKGRSMIATDTPEKEALAERKEKKPKVVKKEVNKVKKRLVGKATKDDSTSGSDVGTAEANLCDDNDNDLSEEFEEIDLTNGLEGNPKMQDYVLVEFKISQVKPIYYIGKILSEEDENGDYEISFLRSSKKISGKFVLPDVPDISSVNKDGIKTVLPQPTVNGATKRQQSFLSFGISFGTLDVR